MDSDFVIELWESMKPYISARERVHAADEIVSLFDAHGFGDGLENSVDLPAELRAAVIAHFDLEDEDDEEEMEW
jgi:hypothetical protein